MKLYISKNIENIHLINNYHIEAEYRLITYHALLNVYESKKDGENFYAEDGSDFVEETNPHNLESKISIYQILISTGFIKYIVEEMLGTPKFSEKG